MQLQGPAKGLQLARMSYENSMLRDEVIKLQGDFKTFQTNHKQSRHGDVRGGCAALPEARQEAVMKSKVLDEVRNEQVHADGYVVLLMFFGCLIIGASLMLLLDRFAPAVPYTVAMFLVGVAFACWHWSRTPTSTISWHTWFRSVEKWESINPHLLFYSFLPPLIFSEAMKLNVRLVQKCFAQVFLLACPGVLLGTTLVATVARFLLPYDWSWAVSLTFGAVLSATDPVAVSCQLPKVSKSCAICIYLQEQFAKQTKLLEDVHMLVKITNATLASMTSVDCLSRQMSPFPDDEERHDAACGQAVKMHKQLTLPPLTFEEPKPQNFCGKIVSSSIFSNGVQLLIMLNLIILGIEERYKCAAKMSFDFALKQCGASRDQTSI
eukprot:g22930.t1